MNAQRANRHPVGFASTLATLGAAAAAGQVLALFPPGPNNWTAYIMSWALLGLLCIFAIRHGQGTRWWTGLIVPLGYLATVVILLGSLGTARTGLSLLLFLPVLWSSLYLGPWTSALTVSGAVAAEAHLAISGHANSGVVIARSLVLWAVMGSFIAVSAHSLRTRLERSTARSTEAARIANILRDAAEALIGLRTPDEVVEVGTTVAAELASPPGVVRRAAFYRIVGNDVSCHYELDDSGARSDLAWTMPDNPLVERAVNAGRPVASAIDGFAFPPELQAFIAANGITHGAAVPVRLGAQVFGALTVASRGVAIRSETIDVLDTLGHLMELALTGAVASQEAEMLAPIDPLTGLYNRRGLDQAVVHGRGRQAFSVLAFDLDGLKAMNDERGHDSGDLLLKIFAATVSSQLRSGDVFARVGGDEFMAVVFAAGEMDAQALASRILRAANAQVVAGVPVSVSIGIADGTPADTFEGIARAADAAMYKAKSSGGDTYVHVASVDAGVAQLIAIDGVAGRAR